MRHRLLSNIVSVSKLLICVYAFVSTDGSLPKEAKGDGSSQIAGETHLHTPLLTQCFCYVCLEMTGAITVTLLIFQHPCCDSSAMRAMFLSVSAFFNRITPRCFRF